jgi:predicted outer membrane protein
MMKALLLAVVLLTGCATLSTQPPGDPDAYDGPSAADGYVIEAPETP